MLLRHLHEVPESTKLFLLLLDGVTISLSFQLEFTLFPDEF
jgi:hypothetical protein